MLKEEHWRPRDRLALTWIGQQYAIRLDQLQWLLGQQPGKRAQHPNWISEGSARDVVTRWKKAGLVHEQQIFALEPFWLWPTQRTLTAMSLPYRYRDIRRGSLDDLEHLYAINEIRLHRVDRGATWVSEREMLQGVTRTPGKESLHRPDGEMVGEDKVITAIEAELSQKRGADLVENLMELVRGAGYLQLKGEHGPKKAKELSQGMQSKYGEIWYFAPPEVRKQVQEVRKRMLERGELLKEEARCIFVKRYPVARTEEQREQEEEEDNQALGLDE